MPNLFGGKKFNFGGYYDSYDRDFNIIQELISDGYKFYVMEDKVSDGYDHSSGMPNTKTTYYAFDNRNDAEEFANITIGNVFTGKKSDVHYLDDLLTEIKDNKNKIDTSLQKDAETAAKRKAYQDNLPQWRNKRTSVLKVYNEIDRLKREIENLKPEYNRLLAELKDELDKAGIKYNNVEDVLDTEFLKQFRNKK